MITFPGSGFPCWLRTPVLLLAIAMGVSGCSGSVETGGAGSPSAVESTTPATPSATSTQAPTPKQTAAAYKPATSEGPAENVPVPEMPAAAKENTPQGREAFIKYYFDLMNYTIESRDPSIMSAETAKGSRYLLNLMSVAYSQAQANTWTVGGELVLIRVEQAPGADPYGVFQDIVVWDKKPYKYYQNGKFGLGEEGGQGRTWIVESYFGDAGWTVQEFKDPNS